MRPLTYRFWLIAQNGLKHLAYVWATDQGAALLIARKNGLRGDLRAIPSGGAFESLPTFYGET